MKTKQYIGTYYSEEELISKMDELHIQGHREEDFYVIVKEKSDIELVRSQMDAEIAATKPSWMDRIRGNKGRDQEVDQLFDSLDLPAEDVEERKVEVEGGGFVLLIEVQDIQFDPHLNTDNTHEDVKVRYGSYDETHTSSAANSNAQLGSGNTLDVDRDSKEEHAEVDLHRAGTDQMPQDEQAINRAKVEQDRKPDIAMRRDDDFKRLDSERDEENKKQTQSHSDDVAEQDHGNNLDR
ncbi:MULTISPECIES: general stress protein [unclassified Exiguobacterium]|uniref:general stress protein n=1 Tax=unclassified Exiguobacterium TaxID=2644629 RepID=UPI000B58C71B|nr:MULTISPECIES: general stress protein [unclassified Exiguobacterium]ASI34407.1 Heat induced stress protein YflT [Exiguobacterium sp. N4-1P]